MLRKMSALVVALALLAGCGSASAPGASPSGSGASSAPAASATARSSASAIGSSSPSADASAEPSTEASGSAAAPASPNGSAAAVIGDLSAQSQVVVQSIAQIAAQTGVQVSDLQLQSAEATEWSDGSLGCPDPATSYIQVITSGYKVVLTDGTRTYDIHTSDSGNAVWCDNGTAKSLTGN